MKACLFLFAVLAVLVTCNDAAAIRDAVASGNLILGNLTSGDRLLHNRYYRENPMNIAVINGEIPYLGDDHVRITYIEALEMGVPQNATATLTSGGIGLNHATITLRSMPGGGFYYLVRIYGR